MAEKSKGFGGKPGSGEEEAASLLGESVTADPDDVSDFAVDPPVFSSEGTSLLGLEAMTRRNKLLL